jgi:PDZ domain-containing protein
VWETDRPERSGRAHWLVIESLGRAQGASLDDFDEVAPGPRDFGMRVDLERPGPPRVIDVVRGSDAQTLGLERGDSVLEADGRTIASNEELLQALQRYVMGTPLRVVVVRKARRVPLQAVLPAAVAERIFKRTRPSGRVELVRRGNAVLVQTRGVRRFTLLLSPDEFDFAQPVRVSVNGRPAFEGRIERSLETLLTWGARDDDRTMLFAAELRIELH